MSETSRQGLTARDRQTAGPVREHETITLIFAQGPAVDLCDLVYVAPHALAVGPRRSSAQLAKLTP